MPALSAPYLSVRQPYAQAIVTGLKDIDNRSFYTDCRGLVIIHAGKSRSCLSEPDPRCPPEWFGPPRKPPILPLGQLIGAAWLIDCLWLDEPEPETLHKTRECNLSFCRRSQWACGPFCWLFDGAVYFDHPVPFTANVGLRRLPQLASLVHPDDLARIREFQRLAGQ